MKDVIISYGHSPIGGKDTGASAYKSTENVLTRQYLKPYINKGLKELGISYTNVSEKKKDYRNIKDQWAHGKPYGYKLKISIHLNSTPTATGSIVETTSNSIKSASKLSKAMANALRTNNRGPNTPNLYMLRKMGYDYLLEPCFCDNKSDYNKYIKYHKELAQAIVAFIADELGHKYTEAKVIKKTYPRLKNNLKADKLTPLDVGKTVKVYRSTKHWSLSNYGWIFKKRLK